MRRSRTTLAACLITAFCCTRGAALLAQSTDNPDFVSASFVASSAVPLDSWVYTAFDRLNALGYSLSALQGMRPWTRLQCARLAEEAEQSLKTEADAADPETLVLVNRLLQEFAYEIDLLQGSPNRSAGIASVYMRATQIAGPPLRDSYHFAQTISDDFGRPFGQGFNFISGTQVHAEYGPFAIALRGEFQEARGLFPYNSTALNAIAAMDELPVQALPGITALDRMRPVDATVSLKLLGWQATFGEQSQWWGQSRANSLILSNNAEAPVVLLIQKDRPIQLPWIFAYLGKMNNSFFVGELRGHHYVRGPYPNFVLEGSATKTLNPQPFIWGDQLDLKISPNLEFGFEISSMWAGYGRPATVGTWFHTFSFHGNAQALDPGKRFGGAHFSYRLPFLKDVTIFTDAMANDEPTPLIYETRSAMNPGIYIARLPRLHHVDARAEAVYTNIPNYKDGVGAVYFNGHYADGYRNAGQLMGSWVGRAGTGLIAQSTYWFSGVNQIDVSMRRQYNDRHMIGGGDLTDFSAHTLWQLKGPWQLEGSLTAERWRFPILQSSLQNVVTAAFGVTFTPPYKAAK
ncbi:MAG: capsule assembly Wzi family protein [Terracidiphilus sp.]